MAFGLGAVGGAAGVGFAVVSSGCGPGRGWSLCVAGREPSPLLAESLAGMRCWLVYPSVLVVFLAFLHLSWRRLVGFFGVSCLVCVCGAGSARAFVCGVCLCRFCWRRPWWCVFCGRGCVSLCLVCWRCVWVPALASQGLGWQLCVGVGAVCRGPSPALAVGPGCGSRPLLAGDCWWWCVAPPPPLRGLSPLSFGCVAWRAVPLVPCPGLPRLWWVCGGAEWGGGGP